MDFERFTNQAKQALSASQQILQRYKHSQLDIEHILLAFLEQDGAVVPRVLDQAGVNRAGLVGSLERELGSRPQVSGPGAGDQQQVYITPHTHRVLDLAWTIAQRMGDSYIAGEHVLLAIVEDGQTAAARLLAQAGLSNEKLLQALQAVRGTHRVDSEAAESKYEALKKYSRDLTELAQEGRLDPVIGRDKEIRRVIQVLSRRTKNNPVLIGEAGVGKTAIVEGLAQAIAKDEVPSILHGKRVLALDLGGMIAGSKYRGEFEERLKAVMDEIRAAQERERDEDSERLGRPIALQRLVTLKSQNHSDESPGDDDDDERKDPCEIDLADREAEPAKCRPRVPERRKEEPRGKTQPDEHVAHLVADQPENFEDRIIEHAAIPPGNPSRDSGRARGRPVLRG